MFRNPRETANPTITTPVKPSTGRSPTPPNETETPRRPATMVTRTNSMKPLTPRPTSKTNFPAAAKQGIKKPFSAKTPAKPNSSILNFFKKVDSPKQQDESIFLSQPAGAATFPARTKLPSLDLLDTGLVDLYGDGNDTDSARFNEAGGSMKKRKTSNANSPSGSDQDEYDSNAANGALVQGIRKTNGCTSPPPQPMNKAVQKKPRHTGPFLSDSESDDEEENSTIPKVAVKAERQELHSKALNQLDDMNDVVETKSINQDKIHENKPVVSKIESVIPADRVTNRRKRLPIAAAQAKWEALQPNTPSTDENDSDWADNNRPDKKAPTIPFLEKESTSVDEWGKFDDIEDFPDYDEFAEGEEFIERKWMEEQAALDAAEAGDGGETFNGFYDDSPEQPLDEEATSKCPICDASLKGVDPVLATRHVNGCLDGNPVPLPAPVKKETSELKLIPPEAKNRFAQKAAIARPGQSNPINIGSTGTSSSSAFSKLMSGHAEDAAWAAASASEQSSRGKPAYQRTCPFYKIMPGFFICVDAFRYGAVEGCKAYFLSHFHSDHYIGLTSSWCHGPIYCSKVTANLVKQQLRVDPKWVVALEFEQRFEVPSTKGVDVTMIPANHCPGSSLFLYEKVVGKGANPKVQRVLHCGDFRACPAHIYHPLLMPNIVDSITGKTKQQKIDVCYLDTTYLNPRYSFPSQEEVIKACADMCVSLKKERAEEHDAWEVVKRERAGTSMTKFVNTAIKAEDDSIAMSLSTKNSKPRGRLLVICGTYSIGKERICLGIARALDCKIWAPPGKMRICAALEDPELMSRMTDNPREAQIHMQMLMEIRAETLQEYLNSYKPYFSRIVGFRPSGWNYRPPNSRSTDSPSIPTILHSTNWRSSYSMAELVPQRGSTREASCFGVPYSEHSSFRELTIFVCALRIEKVVPTVNVGTAAGRAKMKAWIERWMAERRKNGVVKLGDGEGELRW